MKVYKIDLDAGYEAKWTDIYNDHKDALHGFYKFFMKKLGPAHWGLPVIEWLIESKYYDQDLV